MAAHDLENIAGFYNQNYSWIVLHAMKRDFISFHHIQHLITIIYTIYLIVVNERMLIGHLQLYHLALPQSSSKAKSGVESSDLNFITIQIDNNNKCT
jgi:hypothetical protein